MTDNPHYVTPEDAENRICVQAMQIVMPMDTETSPCEGPRCMAWRWRLMRYAEEKDPETDSWPAIYSTTHGYCGMVRP